MKNTYIYTLIDPITNEIRYVGKAIKPKNRLVEHIRESKKKSHNPSHKKNWIKGLLSKNKTPKIEILDEVPSNEWEFWETYWISQLKCWGFKLTNISPGGYNNNYKRNNKTKQKMRQSKLGTTLSDTHKKQISDSIKKVSKERPNYNRSGNNIKNIINKDLLYKLYIDENLSMPKISKKIGFSEKKIWQSLQEYNIKKDKSIWKKQLSTQPKKPVLQYNLDGEFMKEWSSPIDIHKEYGYNKSNIANVCRGVAKTCNGFIWRYKNEFIELKLPKKTRQVCQYDKNTFHIFYVFFFLSY